MKESERLDPGSLNELIDELTAEAGSDDERIWKFQQALQKHIWLPCEGFVIGERVTVIAFEYDGNQRRAVTAACRRADGRQYEVAASEVVIPPNLPGADYLAAYRQWMGLDPYPPTEGRDTSRHDTASIDLHQPVELVVLSGSATTRPDFGSANCRSGKTFMAVLPWGWIGDALPRLKPG